MNKKNLITVLTVTIIVIGAAIFFISTKNQKQSTVAPPTTIVTQQSTQSTTQLDKNMPTNEKIYENKEYGFQITLTDNWKNYSTETEIGYKRSLRDVELNDPNRKRIKFCLETQSDKECLWGIDIINSKINNEYEKDINECEKEQKETGIALCPCNTEIGRNDKYIFLGKVIVQDSSDKGMIALQDVSKILSSFQLTK